MSQRSLCILLLVFTLLAGLCLPAAVQAKPGPQARFDALDAHLEAQRQAAHIQGLSVAIVEGDQVVHLKGFGVAGPSGEAVTPQTLFILGSVSKGFTALAVMQLVEAGQVKLDAPVKTYLPWFPLEDVTVRHLLNQTSGITTATGRMGMTDTDTRPDAILRGARLAASQPRTREAGKKYEYSNANYMLLGALVEAVTGGSYEAYVTRQIFMPLNMPLSFARPVPAGEQHMSMGYIQWFTIPVATEAPFPGAHVAGGFLTSCAEDMSHYLLAQLNGGLYQGRRVLSDNGITTLHSGADPDKPGMGYAMGWEVSTVEGLRVIQHGGDVANFHTNVILLPEQKMGIAVLVNTNSTLNGELINHLAWDAAHLVIGQAPVALQRSPVMTILLAVILATALATLVIIFISARLISRAGQGRPPRWSGFPHPKGWAVALALEILLVSIAWLTLIQMSAMFDAPIPVMTLFSPDLGWPALVSGALAGIWALVFPVMLLLERSRVKAHR